MMERSLGSKNKFHMVSLGCARNRSDSEVMLGALKEDGWSHCQDPESSDAIVINTCAFIDDAKDESIAKILEAADIKRSNPDTKVIVTGCLSQRYKSQLKDGLPEVDLFIGTDEFPRIPNFLKENLPAGSVKAKRTNYLYSGELPKENTLSSSSAYVKVAEGCQHNCSFCIIPAIRGRLRSRPIDSIVSEVGRLGDQGVKEINLIAQDLAAYGRDTGEYSLRELLEQLVEVDKISWLRMLYVYPENISDDFLSLWSTSDKIVPYIDIPVQHAADGILSTMNRDVSADQIRATIERVRAAVPNVAIRTSVMVGFPGETDNDFRDLMRFVRAVEFDHLGCFTYSKEQGTVAGRMSNQIAKDVMLERQSELMALQQGISQRKLRSYIGSRQKVLVKGLSDETDLLYEGRLATQAPEVDGLVYINDGPALPGQIQEVLITETHEYDLVGEVVVKSESCDGHFS